VGASKLVNQFRHRADRYLPRPVRAPGLETRLELRPARFALGLGEFFRWDEIDEARNAPVNGAFYLGRVEEVSGDDVLATVWERPSGREASTTLSVKDNFQGKAPASGNLLRIWTWVELPGQDERVPRLKVEVEEPQLTDTERQELRALAESLEKEVLPQESVERTDEA